MGSGETTPEIVVWPENDKYCVNRSYGVDRMYDYLDEFSTFKEALDFIKSIIKEDFPTEFKYPKNYYGGINIGSIVFCSDKDSASDHVGLVVRDETNFRKLLSDLREAKISPNDIFSEKFQEENESRYSRSGILERAIKEAETSDWDR